SRLAVSARSRLAVSRLAGSSRDSRLGQVGSRQFDEPGKRAGIVDGDVGECLAVQLDQRALQPGDELAVTDAAHPASGVDADNPRGAEAAFGAAPARVGEAPGADQRDERLPIEIVTAEAEALGQLLQTFAAARDGLAAASACHGLFTPLDARAVGLSRP